MMLAPTTRLSGLGVSAKCWVLPFLPQCAAEWGQAGSEAYTQAKTAEAQQAETEAGQLEAKCTEGDTTACESLPDVRSRIAGARYPACTFWLGNGGLGQTVCPNPGPYVIGAVAVLGFVLWSANKGRR